MFHRTGPEAGRRRWHVPAASDPTTAPPPGDPERGRCRSALSHSRTFALPFPHPVFRSPAEIPLIVAASAWSSSPVVSPYLNQADRGGRRQPSAWRVPAPPSELLDRLITHLHYAIAPLSPRAASLPIRRADSPLLQHRRHSMLNKRTSLQRILTAVVVAAGLASCSDAPITSTNILSSRYPYSRTLQVDSIPTDPGGGVTPQGCAEDQQETIVDGNTGDVVPCPLPGIVVVGPPPPPPPTEPPPPSDPAPPPPSGGGSPSPTTDSCDPYVDWDPDCPIPPEEVKPCPPVVNAIYWWERAPDRNYLHQGPASMTRSTIYVTHYSFLVHAWIDGRRHWVRGRGYLFPTDCAAGGAKELRGAVIESMYWEDEVT
jgi:hypothetical protein